MKNHRKNKAKRRKSLFFFTCLIFLIVLACIFLFSPIFKDKEIDSGEIKHGDRIGIVCKGETAECFYIDEQGIAFEQAPQTSGSLVLLIKDYSEREYRLRKEIFEQRIVNFISQVKQGLLGTGLIALDFNILSFPPKDLKVMTSEGWYILFDLERDIKSQLSGLKAALEEKISEEERKNLEYVDLRIENRIYYK